IETVQQIEHGRGGQAGLSKNGLQRFGKSVLIKLCDDRQIRSRGLFVFDHRRPPFLLRLRRPSVRRSPSIVPILYGRWPSSKRSPFKRSYRWSGDRTDGAYVLYLFAGFGRSGGATGHRNRVRGRQVQQIGDGDKFIPLLTQLSDDLRESRDRLAAVSMAELIP